MYKNLKLQISLISLLSLTSSPVTFAAENALSSTDDQGPAIIGAKTNVSGDEGAVAIASTDSGVSSNGTIQRTNETIDASSESSVLVPSFKLLQSDLVPSLGSSSLPLTASPLTNSVDSSPAPERQVPSEVVSTFVLLQSDLVPSLRLPSLPLTASPLTNSVVSSPAPERQVPKDASLAQPLVALQNSNLSASTDSLKSSKELERKVVEKVDSNPKTTKLGVKVEAIQGELPVVTSRLHRAIEGKDGLAELPVQRIFDASGPYPVASAAVAAGLEAVFDHHVNLNAKGRAQLKIRPDEKVRISHLYQIGVGTSSSAILATLLYSNKGDPAAILALRQLAHRGYTMFDKPGTIEGLNSLLSIILGAERFENGVIEGNSLCIRVFNTRTGTTEVLSNSPSFPTYKELSLTTAVQAASIIPGLFASQYLPLGKEDGPFREALPDSGYSIYQKDKTLNKSSYEILSIGSDVRGFQHDSVTTTDPEAVQKLLTAARQSQGAAFDSQSCIEVEDPRAPLTSFASLQLREDQLGKADDYRPSHVRKMVNIGLQAMDSEVFRRVVEQLGFQMPEPDDIKRIKANIRRLSLYDLSHRIYSELSPSEQMWLRRSVLAMTHDFDFTLYRELNHGGKLFADQEKQTLLNAVATVIHQDQGKDKWCKKWSKLDLSISEGVLRGCEFTSLMQKANPLSFQQISDGDEKNSATIIESFVTACNSQTAVFKNSNVDDFTPYLARIFWTYMISEVKDTASPDLLRQFQRNCLAKANKTISNNSSIFKVDSLFRTSREWTLADDLGKYLDELFGPIVTSTK